eukprot:jgi/Ulvmu1/11301/UM074_0016.1
MGVPRSRRHRHPGPQTEPTEAGVEHQMNNSPVGTQKRVPRRLKRRNALGPRVQGHKAAPASVRKRAENIDKNEAQHRLRPSLSQLPSKRKSWIPDHSAADRAAHAATDHDAVRTFTDKFDGVMCTFKRAFRRISAAAPPGDADNTGRCTREPCAVPAAGSVRGCSDGSTSAVAPRTVATAHMSAHAGVLAAGGPQGPAAVAAGPAPAEACSGGAHAPQGTPGAPGGDAAMDSELEAPREASAQGHDGEVARSDDDNSAVQPRRTRRCRTQTRSAVPERTQLRKLPTQALGVSQAAKAARVTRSTHGPRAKPAESEAPCPPPSAAAPAATPSRSACAAHSTTPQPNRGLPAATIAHAMIIRRGIDTQLKAMTARLKVGDSVDMPRSQGGDWPGYETMQCFVLGLTRNGLKLLGDRLGLSEQECQRAQRICSAIRLSAGSQVRVVWCGAAVGIKGPPNVCKAMGVLACGWLKRGCAAHGRALLQEAETDKRLAALVSAYVVSMAVQMLAALFGLEPEDLSEGGLWGHTLRRRGAAAHAALKEYLAGEPGPPMPPADGSLRPGTYFDGLTASGWFCCVG